MLSFYNNRDRDAFIALARKHGLEILDRMDFAHSVRVRTGKRSDLDAALAEGPPPISDTVNHIVRSPERTPAKPKEPLAHYLGFADRSLTWLGVPADNSSWGKGVTVAVLDTGVLPHTALLEANITRVDLLPSDDQAKGDHSWHATAVASLIAGNSPDLRGVAPASGILSIRVMSGNGQGDAFTVARGIVEAVDRGATIVNMCLGTYGDSLILRQAVSYAVEHGAIIVAASGNDAIEGITYPARYDGVMAVSGVDALEQHMYFANRGQEVDIAAPALDVTAAYQENAAARFSGTSAAAPFVSAALAWLLSANPDLTPSAAADLLCRYANDAGIPGSDSELGNGILSIRRLQERNTPGIYDAAVTVPFLQPVQPGANTVTVSVSAQNRGTETIPGLELRLDVNGIPQTRAFRDVTPGQTVSMDARLDIARIRSEPTRLASSVRLEGVTDARPADNSRTTTLEIAEPK